MTKHMYSPIEIASADSHELPNPPIDQLGSVHNSASRTFVRPLRLLSGIAGSGINPILMSGQTYFTTHS